MDGFSFSGRFSWQEEVKQAPLHLLFPPGAETPAPQGTSTIFLPDGFFERRAANERRYGAEAELKGSVWSQHRWLLGLGYSVTQVTNSWLDTNFIPFPPPPQRLMTIQRLTGTQSWLPAGIERDLFSLTLQDQWQINDRLELTRGCTLRSLQRHWR